MTGKCGCCTENLGECKCKVVPISGMTNETRQETAIRIHRELMEVLLKRKLTEEEAKDAELEAIDILGTMDQFIEDTEE